MAEIRLSDGQVSQVDEEDFAAVTVRKWQAVGRDKRHVMTYVPGRGPRGGKRTCLYLHQFIAKRMGLEIPPGCEIDHKNTDSLDNRRNNLRVATAGQQRCNQSARRDNALGIKGVCLEKKSGRYKAEIQANKTRYFLGSYDTAEQAGEAYANAAKKLHGEFARTT